MIDPRLAQAIARGQVVRDKVKLDEGGGLSPGETARLLGIPTAAVLERWRGGRLVAWTEGRLVRFPAWQFRQGKLLPGIAAILRVFHRRDPWRVMVYFLGHRLSLRNRRPLDLLRSGKTRMVLEHAKAHAADNTW